MPECNSVEAIEKYLVDLEGLNQLVKDRHAAYEAREKAGCLHEFCILGRWWTDACGNLGRLRLLNDRYKPIEIPDALPRVVPQDEMARYSLTHWEWSAERAVPPSHVRCEECKQLWRLGNAHDFVAVNDDIPAQPAGAFVGKTIDEFAESWRVRDDAQYIVGWTPSVRNDKLVDLTPDPKWPTLKQNEGGWYDRGPTPRHLTKEYVLEEGDHVIVSKLVYRHSRCNTMMKADRERAYFEKMFGDAGFKDTILSEIPNGYCPCEICAPWYIARLPFGNITIGWRKRVINIDWSHTKRDLSKLFEKENVTKDPTMIHAWGTEKGVDYLKRIREDFAEHPA